MKTKTFKLKSRQITISPMKLPRFGMGNYTKNKGISNRSLVTDNINSARGLVNKTFVLSTIASLLVFVKWMSSTYHLDMLQRAL